MAYRVKGISCMAILAVIFVAFGCSKEPQYIQTVTPFDNPYLLQTDTFTAAYETERVDSFQTSGTSQIILGYNNDPIFGTVNASSYFRLTMPSVTQGSIGTITQGYDSMYLILKPTARQFYGDTLSSYNINVQRVNQDITQTLQSSNQSIIFYNKQTFGADNEFLGSVSQKIRPNFNDSIRIKMDDALGQQIYNFYKTSAPEITTNDNFQAWFKGLKLSVDSGLTNVIYQMPTNTAVMRFYYHDDNGMRVAKYIDFTVSGAPYQFNNIYGNTQNSPDLAKLTPGKTIPSDSLKHQFYINSLMGIRSKIYFPSVGQIQKLSNFVKILAATVELKPLIYSYNNNSYPLFPSLYMFLQNQDLSFSGPLTASSGTGAQNGSLLVDNLNMLNTRYSYDITSYIMAEQIATLFTTRKLMPWLGSTPGDVTLYRMVGADASPSKQESNLILQLMIYNQQ